MLGKLKETGTMRTIDGQEMLQPVVTTLMGKFLHVGTMHTRRTWRKRKTMNPKVFLDTNVKDNMQRCSWFDEQENKHFRLKAEGSFNIPKFLNCSVINGDSLERK